MRVETVWYGFDHESSSELLSVVRGALLESAFIPTPVAITGLKNDTENTLDGWHPGSPRGLSLYSSPKSCNVSLSTVVRSWMNSQCMIYDGELPPSATFWYDLECRIHKSLNN